MAERAFKSSPDCSGYVVELWHLCLGTTFERKAGLNLLQVSMFRFKKYIIILLTNKYMKRNETTRGNFGSRFPLYLFVPRCYTKRMPLQSGLKFRFRSLVKTLQINFIINKSSFIIKNS